jgi:vanillate O-demethylase monooxygenase subunit
MPDSQIEAGRNTSRIDYAPTNAWYAVAGVEEIGEKLLSRRVMDIPLVLYRTAAGEPIALFDRCPHRWIPLSLGSRIDDEVQCIYHGIQFNADGMCTKVPSQNSSPPENMRVRRYKLVDKGLFTWIWIGDEDRADPDLIPVSNRILPGYSQFFQLCYPIEADFLLLHENVMDTSHPSFLHAGLLDEGQMASASMKVEREGNVVRLIRDCGVFVPSEGVRQFFNLDAGRPVRQVSTTETFAPSMNVINHRFTYPDQPERPPIDSVVMVPITPVSAHQCYHFVGYASSWPAEASAESQAATEAIIRGDQLALEAIEQMRREARPGDTEVHIRADTASLHLRHLIQSMTAQNQ